MSAKNIPQVVVICGDPGGANAIVPVIKQLYSEKKMEILVFAYKQAIDIMEKNNISFFTLDEDITNSAIQDVLQKNHPSIIVTGTSVNTIDLEKKFIRAARKLKIPSIAVLDFWSNYSLRFSDDVGDLKFVPEKIAIMDEIASNDMIAEGFHPDTLIVTGQPAFDALEKFKLMYNNENRQKIRNEFHIHENEFFVLFLSQPLSRMYGDDESNPRFLGYTEKTVIRNLVAALNKI